MISTQLYVHFIFCICKSIDLFSKGVFKNYFFAIKSIWCPSIIINVNHFVKFLKFNVNNKKLYKEVFQLSQWFLYGRELQCSIIILDDPFFSNASVRNECSQGNNLGKWCTIKSSEKPVVTNQVRNPGNFFVNIPSFLDYNNRNLV